jgi:hypothetical protein
MRAGKPTVGAARTAKRNSLDAADGLDWGMAAKLPRAQCKTNQRVPVLEQNRAVNSRLQALNEVARHADTIKRSQKSSTEGPLNRFLYNTKTIDNVLFKF